MPRREPIAEKFFEKDTQSAVGFEITFAALLATVALTYPIPGKPLHSELPAFFLLGITLIRRIAVASPFSPKERVWGPTTVGLEFATVFALISIFSGIILRIPLFQSSGVVYRFSIFTAVTFFILVLLHEYLFRDYFAWWHVKFAQRTEGENVSEGSLWHLLSSFSYLLSLARKNRDSWSQFKSRADSSAIGTSWDDVDFGAIGELTWKAGLLLALIYGLPTLLGLLTLGPAGLLLVIAVIAIHDHSRFWYVAYGDTNYEDFVRPIWMKTSITAAILAVTIVYLPGTSIPDLALPVV